MLTLMAHAEQQVTIANGRITLYRRDDVKAGIWQMRLRMRGVRGYIRRSTGESEIAQASAVAMEILGEIKQRHKQHLPLTAKKFSEVASGYLRDAETRWKEGRSSTGRFLLIRGVLARYLVPYFGHRDIAVIQKKDLIAYRQWRQAYWTTGPGVKDKTARYQEQPSTATLKQEWTVLRGVFDFAVDMNILPPAVMAMLKHDKSEVKRRPVFTAEEYRQLYLFMRSWVIPTTTCSASAT